MASVVRVGGFLESGEGGFVIGMVVVVPGMLPSTHCEAGCRAASRMLHQAVHLGTDNSDSILEHKQIWVIHYSVKIRAVDFQDERPARPLGTVAEHPRLAASPNLGARGRGKLWEGNSRLFKIMGICVQIFFLVYAQLIFSFLSQAQFHENLFMSVQLFAPTSAETRFSHIQWCEVQ